MSVAALAKMDLQLSWGTNRSKVMQIRKGGKKTNKHPRQVIENYLGPGSEISGTPIVTGEATTYCAAINVIMLHIHAVAAHW